MSILAPLTSSRGHFLLESGYHSDVWIALDALLVDTTTSAPLIGALATRLRPYALEGICGPLVGGAFLAQALAHELKVGFYYTEREQTVAVDGLFNATYRLPPGIRGYLRGQTIAVVDDVMSAGSSVRATIAALASSGATTTVVGAFVVLGERALSYFARERIPVEALEHEQFNLWPPIDCPLCRAGLALENRAAQG